MAFWLLRAGGTAFVAASMPPGSRVAGARHVATGTAVARRFFGSGPGKEEAPPPAPEAPPKERDIFDSPVFGIIALLLVATPFLLNKPEEDMMGDQYEAMKQVGRQNPDAGKSFV
eukprot:CAMPEP_0179111732 /NCGR_PEP_ID=MMETSP0796-20121207/52200_1 /TAXON_ID=73915 /ORGANISM="Pyrodinium bahamense, Strain pbaha01" /LENGTH=114 /DNA_ID=CAMNT_0020809889 /DNA_START=29 /DNA_END=373 /DNA_ORIENTATION=-